MSKRQRITVVEHDPMLGMLLLDLLADEGYVTDLWTEPPGAFEQICRTQPDLVILDLWLQQRGDGWQVFDALQRDPRTRQIPVILCADDLLLLQIEGAGVRDGADAVLEKPFDLEQLLALITQILGRDAQRLPWQATPARLPALALDS